MSTDSSPEPSATGGSPAAVSRALAVVGDRWTILVLLELLRGYHRFVELRRRVEGIAPNILSQRLKLLESHAVVTRRFYSQHPPRAEYHLTRKGHELGMVAGALAVWGASHMAEDDVLVHDHCGSPVQVKYYCPSCDRQLAGAAVRIAAVQSDVA